MDTRVKVLHAITRLDRGGSSDNTLLSAIGLAQRGYKVDLLFGATQSADVRLIQEAEKAGIDFIEEENLVRDIHPVKDLFAFLNILHFLRDKKYDIIHAHSSKAGLVCRVAARFAGKGKVVYTPHGHVFYGYFGRALTRMVILVESILARMTDRIIGLTPAECDEWLSLGIGRRGQYEAIPSGIDFSLLNDDLGCGRDLRLELGIPPEGILVGSIGRFVGVKGFEYFVKAAVNIAKKRENIYFVLAGEGPQRHVYEDLIMSGGMEGRFHIIGWQERVACIINAMDIFVLPSLNEGMGRVLVEAMYLGKPVVATRVGGVPSVVSGGTGLLVDPASVSGIAEAICALLDDREAARKMGLEGQERALSEYSKETMVSKLDLLYRQLL